MSKNIYLFSSLFLALLTLLQPVAAQPLADTKICIDPGHGGHTGDDRETFLPNGIVYWESEGDLAAALHLKELLEELGATVKMTRTENSNASDISLSERSAIANAFGADYFHSMHTNGGGGNYSLVLYKEVNGTPAFQTAKEMGDLMAPTLQDLMKTNTHYNRGDFSFLGFNLGVLNYANMPATLSEASFHDLPEEGLRLKNTQYLRNYAWAVAKSFLAYFEVDGFTTGRVGGVVRDATSAKVVNEITVTCQPTGSTYTGDNYYNGFYAIDALNPGDYNLILSKEGYLNDTTAVHITANEYVDLDLTIQYYNNGFPNVDFYMQGLPAGAGEQITFNASNSTDDGTIELYSWDFGDGSPTETGEIVHHQYDHDATYNITMTATDNDGHQSSISKSVDIITNAPIAPKVEIVNHFNEEQGIKIQWTPNPETNILQYHIYYSENDDFSNPIKLDSVDQTINSIQIDSFGQDNQVYYFRITAENIAHKISTYDDTYGLYKNESEDVKSVLIVDGFDRVASYNQSRHSFVSTYLKGLEILDQLTVASCSHTAIINQSINLSDFDMVFWFLGDESTLDETFSNTEQLRVKNYMENGGNLFVTGSEVGWDLVEKGSVNDKSFYHNYLKADFLNDGGAGRTPASGLDNSGFEGSLLNFGQVYPEDYPDEIGGYAGSTPILEYITGAGAGIKYYGTFGTGTTSGALVYIGFPLETVAEQDDINYFIEKVINFFNNPTSAIHPLHPVKNNFKLYPTIVKNQLFLKQQTNQKQEYMFEIYSSNGKKYYSEKRKIHPDDKKISLPVSKLSTGIYFLSIRSSSTQQTFRFVKE